MESTKQNIDRTKSTELALLNIDIIIRILDDRFAQMKVCIPYDMRICQFLIHLDVAFLRYKLALKSYRIVAEYRQLKLYRMFGLAAICYYGKDHEGLLESTNEDDYRLWCMHFFMDGMIQDQLSMLLRQVKSMDRILSLPSLNKDCIWAVEEFQALN